MSSTALTTVGITLEAGGAQVLDRNLHRKVLLIAATSSEVQFAFGPNPAAGDYATLLAGSHILFDSRVPVMALWLKGSGSAIVGTEAELPFNGGTPGGDPTDNWDFSAAQGASLNKASAYSGVTIAETLKKGGLGGFATTVTGTYPIGTGGGIDVAISPAADVTSITYKADANFNLNIKDADLWRWWVLLPASEEYTTVYITKEGLNLSSYQPDHPSDPKPTGPNYTTLSEVTLVLDTVETVEKHISYQYLNVKAK